MKKIEPTPMEDWALQQQVGQYIRMTPILGNMRQSVERQKGGHGYADEGRKTAGPEAH
jgi:hypothetical protein